MRTAEEIAMTILFQAQNLCRVRKPKTIASRPDIYRLR